MFDLLQDTPYLLVSVEIIYLIAVVLLSVKIIIDTKTNSKTLAYLLLLIFLPIFGIIFYFVFGVNYRKRKFYNFKIERDEKLFKEIRTLVGRYHRQTFQKLDENLKKYQNTINFIFNSSNSPIVEGNYVEVLINGEEKFAKVFERIKEAKHHIHLEYYIYRNDKIGNALADLLIKKSEEGVIVRFLYDDFGSRKISRTLLKRLRIGGVQTAPVNKIKFKLFANRVNYRDHRKIIIIDGVHVFSGGINVSDTNINPNTTGYWRDTHLYLRGKGAFYFQYLFLTTWIFSTRTMLTHAEKYFVPEDDFDNEESDKVIQVAASGPDMRPTIMLTAISTIYDARKRVYITTPYFVPTESVLQALKTQARAGVDVRLLVPEKGDSKLVDAAAYSYYEELLKSGVRVYFYDKGFIHSKTMIIDDFFSSIGTANIDVRSHELNFEVNTYIYDRSVNQKLYEVFLKDLEDSHEIYYEEWLTRSRIKEFFEHLARLFSPLL